MVVYKCPKCNKVFNHKSHFMHHINIRKKDCTTIKTQIIDTNQLSLKMRSNDFKCLKCHKVFTRKYNLNRHIQQSCKGKINISKMSKNNSSLDSSSNRTTNNIFEHNNNNSYSNFKDRNSSEHKNEHKNEHKSGQKIINGFKCCHCDKMFTTKTSKYRHQRLYCKVKKEKDNTYQMLMKEMNNMKEIIKKQQNKIKKLENNEKNKNVQNITNSIFSNNTVNNTQNNFNIIAFGKEDLYTMFSDDQVKKYISGGFQSIIRLIDKTHFDPDKPEFHNVYISNMKDIWALIFDGERWNLTNQGEVIDQLFDDKYCYLNDMFKEVGNTLNHIARKKFNRFINNKDKKITENLKKDIKLLLYNKRDIPIKTRINKSNFNI